MGKQCCRALLSIIFLVTHMSMASASEYQLANNGWNASLDYKYQAWEPDDIYGADLLTTGINLVGLQIGSGSSKTGFAPMLRYEWSPMADSAAQDELLKVVEEETSAWERLFADLKWTFNSGNSLSFIYDKQTYLTSVQTGRDYWYFDGGNVTLLIPGDIVQSTTVMQDMQLIFGTPLFQAGVFSLSYEKPFSTDIQNGQIGIYSTQLDAMGVVLKSQYDSGIWGVGASYKYGLQSDLTIGASSSAAALLGTYGNTLDFSELAASFKVEPYKGIVDVQMGVEYKVRSMSGDIQLTRDDVASLYISMSKTF